MEGSSCGGHKTRIKGKLIVCEIQPRWFNVHFRDVAFEWYLKPDHIFNLNIQYCQERVHNTQICQIISKGEPSNQHSDLILIQRRGSWAQRMSLMAGPLEPYHLYCALWRFLVRPACQVSHASSETLGPFVACFSVTLGPGVACFLSNIRTICCTLPL